MLRRAYAVVISVCTLFAAQILAADASGREHILHAFNISDGADPEEVVRRSKVCEVDFLPQGAVPGA